MILECALARVRPIVQRLSLRLTLRKERQRCHIKASWNGAWGGIISVGSITHIDRASGKHRYKDAYNPTGPIETFQECIMCEFALRPSVSTRSESLNTRDIMRFVLSIEYLSPKNLTNFRKSVSASYLPS